LRRFFETPSGSDEGRNTMTTHRVVEIDRMIGYKKVVKQ